MNQKMVCCVEITEPELQKKIEINIHILLLVGCFQKRTRGTKHLGTFVCKFIYRNAGGNVIRKRNEKYHFRALYFFRGALVRAFIIRYVRSYVFGKATRAS